VSGSTERQSWHISSAQWRVVYIIPLSEPLIIYIYWLFFEEGNDNGLLSIPILNLGASYLSGIVSIWNLSPFILVVASLCTKTIFLLVFLKKLSKGELRTCNNDIYYF